MEQRDKTIAIGLMLVFLGFGLTFGYMIGSDFKKWEYQKCRYFEQTIDRCIIELGWESK